MSYYKEIVVRISVEGYQYEDQPSPTVYAGRELRCSFDEFSNAFDGQVTNALYKTVGEVRKVDVREEIQNYLTGSDEDDLYALLDAVRKARRKRLEAESDPEEYMR
jgi:hypothetical protein